MVNLIQMAIISTTVDKNPLEEKKKKESLRRNGVAKIVNKRV